MIAQQKPLKIKQIETQGDIRHNVKLEQYDSRCHLPTSTGVEMMNTLCEVSDNCYLGFSPSVIYSVCDCCSGSGNFGVICDKLFPNLTSLHCVDIFKPYVTNSLHNYTLNGIGCGSNTVRITATHANIAYFFRDLCYNSRDEPSFDLITCNPPNFGRNAACMVSSDVSDNSFTFTLGDDIGRFVLDTFLLDSYKCLKDGGFLFFTDTSLNNPNGETEYILEDILNLKRNKDWIVVKEYDKDFMFNQCYSDRVKKQWIQQLIQDKRIFPKRGRDIAHAQYIQKRRFLLARKAAQSKL
eukprot:230979_1